MASTRGQAALITALATATPLGAALPADGVPRPAVIDGHDDFVGSDRRRIERALAAPRRGVAIALTRQADLLLVDLPGAAASPATDVVLAAYRRSAATAVDRGENAGRTLQEVNIVRERRTLGRWTGDAHRFEVRLATLPDDATDVATLVQPAGQAPLIGAGTLALR